ncbi:MAG: isoprenylcysteine carboxylmethyltransferase family protein [Candidatus Krumholzibacteriia bacterium]
MNRLARWRIPLSQAFCYLLLAITAVAGSRWSTVGPVFALVGLFLMAAGILGRLWCTLYIGGHKRDTLVTEGPYSLCRHPLYLANLVGATGVALATRTLTIPAVLLLAFAACYPPVMRSEDAELDAAHGPAFRRYREATPAFLPRPRRLREPTVVPAHAVAYRRELAQTGWFVVAYALVSILGQLHAAGVLPVLLTLH